MHRLPETLKIRGRPLADIRESIVEFFDLVSAPQIAERTGLHRSIAHKWAERYSDFPAPVTETDQGKLWWWLEVEEFIKHRKLAKGRGRPAAE
jgi:predicted DNA-binding transcriptional regulator AlpA